MSIDPRSGYKPQFNLLDLFKFNQKPNSPKAVENASAGTGNYRQSQSSKPFFERDVVGGFNKGDMLMASLGMLSGQNLQQGFGNVANVAGYALDRNAQQSKEDDRKNLLMKAMGIGDPKKSRDMLAQAYPEVVGESMAQKAFGQPATPEGKVVNDRLVNPMTGEVIGDYSDAAGRETQTDALGRLRYVDTGEIVPGFGDAKPQRGPLVQNTITGDQVDPRPIVDKPPKGYQREWDEEAGTYRDIPIPGGSAARDAETENIKSMKALESSRIQFDTMMSNIQSAREATDFSSSGVMGLTSGVPLAPARTLKNRLDTVRANIGFDKLQEMRENSPTGGALGQVSEREIDFLQATRGKIDQLTDPAEIKTVLDEIEASLRRLQEVREIAWQMEYGNTQPGQARTQIGAEAPLNPGDLPAGFVVVE